MSIIGSVARISEVCPIVCAGNFPTDGDPANANVIGVVAVFHDSVGVWRIQPSEQLVAGKYIATCDILGEAGTVGATARTGDLGGAFITFVTRDGAGNVADLAFAMCIRRLVI